MFVTYPAIFYKNKDYEGYTVVFPDFDGGATEGSTQSEALYMAQDYIGSWLFDDYTQQRTLPTASSIDKIVLEDDEDVDLSRSFISLVGMDMDEYVRKSENKTIRRNVSIPSYLNELAKKQNINVSQLLQDALKKELHIF